MTTPNTAAATGTPVKLATYAGVPLDALVAYERAALDLPHDTRDLIRLATDHLHVAIEQGTSEPPTAAAAADANPVSTPLFSKASLRHTVSVADSLDDTYVHAVPLWLQDVAAAWQSSNEQRHRSCNNASTSQPQQQPLSSSSLMAAGGSSVLRAEQQAMWATKTSRLLQEFACSQKLAKSLQRVRKELKASAKHGAAAAPSARIRPRVFTELMKSYEAAARTLTSTGSSSLLSTSGHVHNSSIDKSSHQTQGAAGGTSSVALMSVTPSMWCVLVCRYLRSLPEPLIPALCSRRLEPLLAPGSPLSAAQQRVAVLKVVLESFAQSSIVRYHTFCFVVELIFCHRGELAGGEVEAVAAAMTWESAVPHVVRAIAHACKPEARMFWPAAQAKSTTAALGAEHLVKSPPHTVVVASKQNTVSSAAVGEGAPPPPQQAAKPRSAHEAPTSSSDRNVMAPPQGEDGGSSSETSAESHVREEHRTRQDSLGSEDLSSEDSSEQVAVVRALATAAAQRKSADGAKKPTSTKATPPTNSMQLLDTSSSSSSSLSSSSFSTSDSSDNDSFDVLRVKKIPTGPAKLPTGPSSAQKALHEPNAQSAPELLEDVGPVRKERTLSVLDGAVESRVAVANTTPLKSPAVIASSAAQPSDPQQQQQQQQGTPLVDAPSLVGVSPVRKGDLSLLSQHGRDATLRSDVDDAVVPSVLFSHDGTQLHASHHTARQGGECVQGSAQDDTLPSALASHREPTPLQKSQSTSGLFASAAGEGNKEDNPEVRERRAAEAVPHVVQPSSESPSAAALTSSSSSMPSPSAVELAKAAHSAASTGSAALMAPRPFAQLPLSSTAPAVLVAGALRPLRTPRDVLTHEQQQQQQQEKQDHQEHEEAPRTSSAQTVVQTPTQVPSVPSTSRLSSAVPPDRTRRARPLLAALYEAKQRFLAAPVSDVEMPRESSVTPARTAASEVTPAGSSHHLLAASPSDETERLARVLTCVREQGWSAEDLLRTLLKVPSTSLGANTKRSGDSSARLPTTSSMPPSSTVGKASSPSAQDLARLSELLSFQPGVVPEERPPPPTSTNTNNNGDAAPVSSGDRRVSVRSPPRSTAQRSTVLSSAHRLSASASASLLHLDSTREFRPAGLPSGRGAPTQHGSALDTTRGSLLTPSPDETGIDATYAEAAQDRDEVRQNPSLLTTPVDTAFTTVNTSAVPAHNARVLSAMEKELRQLRELVRTLETNQFVQARQAAAQTSELAAQCAELQRTQRTQEQESRLARSRLVDVSHELEDLRDDKARLQMQLTAARQEGAQLRDAILTGKIRV